MCLDAEELVMDDSVRCENCKHFYSYFKETKDEKGMEDFVIVPRCRLDLEIRPDGRPANPDCFEPRE
jgi:hypothetical protein